jgi:hypothetical protein
MRKPNLPSPSIVLAGLALAVALGGTAYAASLPRNSVGSPQVKPNSLKGVDVNEASLEGVMLGKTRAGARKLFPNTGFTTLVTFPKVGRMEATCQPGATEAFVRFFNTTNAIGHEWITGKNGFSAGGMIAHAGGIPYATGGLDSKTWVIRTTGPKRITVVHVATRVTNGVSCEHYASGYTMNG